MAAGRRRPSRLPAAQEPAPGGSACAPFCNSSPDPRPTPVDGGGRRAPRTSGRLEEPPAPRSVEALNREQVKCPGSSPTAPVERPGSGASAGANCTRGSLPVSSLDALRGFALLGILPANVLFSGMYFAAATDPTVAGGATGLNLASWALFRVLVEGRMRCLFAMAFGVSMILLTSRAEERSAATAADIYYRRTLWLLLFGLAHAFLLFWGDILYPYALCALLLFPFRKLPAKKLLIIGALFIAFKTGWFAVDAFRQNERRRD